MDQGFNIVHFPREIIEHIFSFIVDTKGYASFRQTCWYIYQCTSKVKHFYPSGRLMRTIPISNGNIYGHVLAYHLNDALKYMGLFLDSKREGIHQYFYSDNKLMYKGNYFMDLKRGYHYWYHFNGLLERFTFYIDNKKQGKEVVYHPDGSFRWIINYNDNKIDGTAEFYKDTFENLKHIEIPIKNNVVNGLFVLYNMNGLIQYQGYIQNGYPVGLHKSYYNNGHIKKIIEFKNGKIHGFMKEFYSNGSLKSIVKYTNNLKTSRENTWHNKRGLKSSVTYVQNKKSGMMFKYNFFGELDKKIFFEDDKINGLTELYSKSGLQFRSYSNNIDVLINFLDGKYSTIFFKEENKRVSNLYSFFVDGKIKNKNYNDEILKINFQYNILHELISETYIMKNLVKSVKHSSKTEISTRLDVSDRVLMIPI